MASEAVPETLQEESPVALASYGASNWRGVGDSNAADPTSVERGRGGSSELDSVESGGSEADGQPPTGVEVRPAGSGCSSVAAAIEKALQALDAGRLDIARAVLLDLLGGEVEP
jgi:hypothetical protein